MTEHEHRPHPIGGNSGWKDPAPLYDYYVNVWASIHSTPDAPRVVTGPRRWRTREDAEAAGKEGTAFYPDKRPLYRVRVRPTMRALDHAFAQRHELYTATKACAESLAAAARAMERMRDPKKRPLSSARVTNMIEAYRRDAEAADAAADRLLG